MSQSVFAKAFPSSAGCFAFYNYFLQTKNLLESQKYILTPVSRVI